MEGHVLFPQCQYFVIRKKRLCRMNVRPGHQYCGEHEPRPSNSDDNQGERRVPCPYDHKHSCYLSRLEQHCAVCNARPRPAPAYVVAGVNAPRDPLARPRTPLAVVPLDLLMQVVMKINSLYKQHLEDNIGEVEQGSVHPAVREEFCETGRGEGTRRHLRQASTLLRLAEDEGLVADRTCYVELGAGRGQLSFYMCSWWCGESSGSSALVVDRSSPRHKRDSPALGPRRPVRLRADLADLALRHAPPANTADNIVGMAKHLCGVATDYALRCITEEGVISRTRGLVLATCCHHRCLSEHYVGAPHLREMGIDGEDLNVMLGIVSWATCGDGRSRDRRKAYANDTDGNVHDHIDTENRTEDHDLSHDDIGRSGSKDHNLKNDDLQSPCNKIQNNTDIDNKEINNEQTQHFNSKKNVEELNCNENEIGSTDSKEGEMLPRSVRSSVGRRAKALLDWGRVLYLRECGFDARLCHFVPTSVSLENVCIVAKKGIKSF